MMHITKGFLYGFLFTSVDFNGWDDDKILAAVLAKSQKEYYEQLSNSSTSRNIENWYTKVHRDY